MHTEHITILHTLCLYCSYRHEIIQCVCLFQIISVIIFIAHYNCLTMHGPTDRKLQDTVTVHFRLRWLNIILFLYELLPLGSDINYYYFIITSYFNVMPTSVTHDTVTSTCQHHTSTLLIDIVTSHIHHRHLTSTDPNILHHAGMKEFYRSWALVI